MELEDDSLVLGVDEAGRGPIIGPMVVAGVAIEKRMINFLVEIGVRDSKLLEPSERTRIAKRILSIAKQVVIVEVPPRLIDEENLNVIERNTTAFIVGRVLDVHGGRLTEVYVDAVGNPKDIVSVVRRIGFDGKVVAEKKADTRYPVVSAASIIAKVVRDSKIEELRRMYGVRGSGYPTDPETIEWIKEVYSKQPDNPPPFVRLTWGTLRRIAPRWYRRKLRRGGGSGQRTLLEFM